MRSASLAAVVLAAALATPLMAGAASDAPARVQLRQCPRLKGPTVHQAGQAHGRYLIGLHSGVSCAFAVTWVGKILYESTPNSSIAKPKGPARWQCIANSKQHIAFNGFCRQGTKHFSWGTG